MQKCATLVIAWLVACGALATLSAPAAAQAVDAAADPAHPLEEFVTVFPFANLSGDAADAWLGPGIADTVRLDLQANARRPVVTAERLEGAVRDSGEALPARADLRALALGQAVNATWLVTGSYQRLARQVRITARLIDVRTGDAVRVAKVGGPVDELFEIQDRIVAELGLGPSVASVTAPAGSEPPAAPGPAAPATPASPSLPPAPFSDARPKTVPAPAAFAPAPGPKSEPASQATGPSSRTGRSGSSVFGPLPVPVPPLESGGR